MRIVVGLGNPGTDYVDTRHNVGFEAVDRLAQRLALTFRDRGGYAAIADGRDLPSGGALLVKPMTFMNRSGGPLTKVLGEFGGSIQEVLVVLDDFQLELGRLRMREQGRDGGHNGLQSIIERAETAAVPRLRIGIGLPPGRMPAEDFVLRRFRPAEREVIEVSLNSAADAALAWIQGDSMESLMNRYNGQQSEPGSC